MADFHKNDIGARLVVTILENGAAFDVSGASTKQLKYTHRKTGVTKTFTASFGQAPEGNGTGTDGKLEYSTTTTADLDDTGPWDVRAYLVIPGVWTGHTQKATITVGEVT